MDYKELTWNEHEIRVKKPFVIREGLYPDRLVVKRGTQPERALTTVERDITPASARRREREPQSP
jgi:hypothetical protein